jgi:hypothetical protein
MTSAGQLLGGVGYGRTLVGGQLRADHHERVPLIFGEIDAHAAPSAARGGVDVVGGKVHEGMRLVRSPSPTTFATDLGEPGPAQLSGNMKRSPNPSPLSRPVWTGRERYSSTSGKECSRELRHPLVVEVRERLVSRLNPEEVA